MPTSTAPSRAPRRATLLAALAAFAALLPLLAAPPLGAQDAAPLGGLDTGSVVRVQPSAGARWRVGRLRAVTGDTLWIAHLGTTRDRRPTPLRAPPNEARVEVSPDYDRVSRQRHWVIAGCTLGGMLYAVAGTDRGYRIRYSALVGGLLGVTVGTVAAEVANPRRWTAVRR